MAGARNSDFFKPSQHEAQNSQIPSISAAAAAAAANTLVADDQQFHGQQQQQLAAHPEPCVTKASTSTATVPDDVVKQKKRAALYKRYLEPDVLRLKRMDARKVYRERKKKEQEELRMILELAEKKERLRADRSRAERLRGEYEGLSVSKKVLGRGYGSVVYEGEFGGRKVAVKHVSLNLNLLIKREIDNLIRVERGIGNNIVKYIGLLEYETHVDIILELCTCDLKTLMNVLQNAQNEIPNLNSINEMLEGTEFQEKGIVYPSTELVNFLRGIVNGIHCLHKLGIVHRDIRPQNILITKMDGKLCAKIADMGISKHLPNEKSSLTWTSHAGSLGWRAPELLEERRYTAAVDIFNLGCILFFCITKGKHPFGLERDNLEENIKKKQPDLSIIKDQPEAYDLIHRLLKKDPKERPTAEEVLKHPFFWTAEQKLAFLKAASDRIMDAKRNQETALLSAVEGCLKLNAPWDTMLDQGFVQHMFNFPHAKYDIRKVKDLLRIIRNGLAHFNELPQSAQSAIGMSAEAREAYFSSTFPNLLYNVYQVLLYGQFAGDTVIDEYKWR